MKLAGRLCHNDAAMTAAFVLASTALERISGLGRWLCGFGYGTGTGFESRGRVMALESPESGLVLISVVPHCTQAWVTSSRSSDSAPLDRCYRRDCHPVPAMRAGKEETRQVRCGNTFIMHGV